MVSGPWDFAGVLFAASGFLLLGGPAILTGLHEQWRLSWLLGQARFLQGFGDNWYFWLGLWALYLVIIVNGAIFLLWRRRNQTSIYNVEPSVLDDVLVEALEQLGFDWQRGRTGRFFIRPREESAEASVKPAANGAEIYVASINVETFAFLRHATLHWKGETEWIRPEVEGELAKLL